MTYAGLLSPMFLGPLGFVLGGLILILLLFLIARVVFALAWRLILIGAIVIGVLWLIGSVTLGSPGRPAIGAVLRLLVETLIAARP